MPETIRNAPDERPRSRDVTRRAAFRWAGRVAGFLASLVALWPWSAAAVFPSRPAPERQAARQILGTVRRWGCQYQNLDLAALSATDLDMVVVEPLLQAAPLRPISPEEIDRLKRRPDGTRRLVLAYLSVGEASETRPYWRDAWRAAPPPWLGPLNPDWPAARAVRYWHPDWRALVLSTASDALGGIVTSGYDGVFLDRVDACLAWRPSHAAADDDMVALVTDIAAAARAHRPGFLVVAQNAEPLLMRADYRAVIDAVSKESLLVGLRAPGEPNAEADIAWSRSGLDAARAAGLPVFAIEYLSDTQTIAAARRRLDAWGYVPFFADRLLDRLPAVRG